MAFVNTLKFTQGKKINRIMLNGDGNENGKKNSVGLNNEKNFLADLHVLWRKCRMCSCYPGGL